MEGGCKDKKNGQVELQRLNINIVFFQRNTVNFTLNVCWCFSINLHCQKLCSTLLHEALGFYEFIIIPHCFKYEPPLPHLTVRYTMTRRISHAFCFQVQPLRIQAMRKSRISVSFSVVFTGMQLSCIQTETYCQLQMSYITTVFFTLIGSPQVPPIWLCQQLFCPSALKLPNYH